MLCVRCVLLNSGHSVTHTLSKGEGLGAMVQLISKLTLACAEHACVLQFLSCHMCHTQRVARMQYFVHCT